MWIRAALLLLACCLWSAEAQNIWNNPIEFKTKAGDLCSMSVTGHGEYTRLRMACQSKSRSYWCEYEGKPHTCRSYSKNPRHYFVQMTWSLRKLHNACQAPRRIKPHMCKKADDESQMVFKTASFSRYWPDATWKTAPVAQTASAKPDAGKQEVTEALQGQRSPKATQKTKANPTTAPVESKASRMARLHCWRSLQGVCSLLTRWFTGN